MQADVRLDASESVKAMMIPREAALDDEGKKTVYVLLSGEEFQRREVKLGDEHGGRSPSWKASKPASGSSPRARYNSNCRNSTPRGPRRTRTKRRHR